MYIDTHTHIYMEDYDADRDIVVRRAQEAGCEALLLPNVNASSLEPIRRMCEAYPGYCFPMIGLHPTELPDAPDALLDDMERRLDARPADFVAVGEVGLDFYWDRTRAEEQVEVFKRQIQWAVRHGLPLMIHSRSAHRETVNTLLPYANTLCGVFHCFSGSKEEASELLQRFPGFVLGIGGVLTFKNCKLSSTLAEVVPLERIVLETDAPWLAPTPHRGQRNEPAYITLVVDKLAEIYAVTPEHVCSVTTQTARNIFKMPPTQ